MGIICGYLQIVRETWKKIQEGNTALDWHLDYGVEATLLEASWWDKFWKIRYVADITDFKLLQIILSVQS